MDARAESTMQRSMEERPLKVGDPSFIMEWVLELSISARRVQPLAVSMLFRPQAEWWVLKSPAIM